MKKLLVLLTVLAVSTMASAGMMFNSTETDVLPGTIVTINIVADAPASGIAIGGLVADMGSLSVGQLHANLSSLAKQGTQKEGDVQDIYIFDVGGLSSLGTEPAAGAVLYSFTLDTTGLQNGDIVTIDDWSGINPFGAPARPFNTTFNGVTDDIQAISVNIIPEPMTVALLGLGGLFLRRRK